MEINSHNLFEFPSQEATNEHTAPRTESRSSMETIAIPVHFNEDLMGDPQRIQCDINGLDESVDRLLVLILKKLNDRGSNTTLRIDALSDQVGRPVTSREFFLNGHPEPHSYDDDNTLAENVLALKNVCSRLRISLDNYMVQTNKTLRKLNSSISVSNSNTPLNAVPNAELESMKKEVASALAKVTSLANGNVFSSMDMQSRVTELETQFRDVNHRLGSVAKALGVLKNGSPGSSKNQNTSLPIGINRFDERLLKLEEGLLAQQSKNLGTETLEVRMDLLQKEISDLKKDVKLDRASTETNNWLNAKFKAWLDTPAFLDRIRAEFGNKLVTFQVQPRNMAQETRMLIIKVNK